MSDDFRIRVSRRPGGGFEVAASGPGGEGSGGFSLPFDEKDLRILILEMGVPRGLTRGVKSPAAEAARRLGGGLYEALFQGEVGELFVRSRAIAEARDQPLRVTLALTDVADLMHLPWEYLYDGDRGLFLATSRRTPVVRYLEIPSQRRPMLVVPPLRVLAMISSPSDAATLDVGLERAKLERALDDLSTRGLVSVTWLETATFEALQDELRNPGYHVFHYVGHGGFDPAEDESVLLLETDDGRSLYTTGEQLGALLLDHTSLSLAVLNACEAARVSLRDPFAGVAASLIRREVPAVIAMQFPITDSAAIQFSSELYRAIADGLPIDAALGEARKGLYATDPKSVEWGTPVLFMRVPDGRIFDLDPNTPPSTDEPQPADDTPTDTSQPTTEPDDGPTPPPPPDTRAPGEDKHPGWARKHAALIATIAAIIVAAIATTIILTTRNEPQAPPTNPPTTQAAPTTAGAEPGTSPDEFPLQIGDVVSPGVPLLGAGEVAAPGELDVYTFEAVGGERINLANLPMEGDCPELGMSWSLAHRGSADPPLFSNLPMDDCADFNATYYPLEAGTWVLTVSGATGTYSFQLAQPDEFPLQIGDVVSPGEPSPGAGVIASSKELDLYTFEAGGGERINLANLPVEGNCPAPGMSWSLVHRESGESLLDEPMDDCKSYDATGEPLEAGTWVLTVYGTTGTYSFQITQP